MTHHFSTPEPRRPDPGNAQSIFMGSRFGMKDSGERQSFDTGAVRDVQTDKGRFDLISPLALRRLAKVYEKGAQKYADRNWEKGMPITRALDSAIRHTLQFLEGHTDEDHAAHAAWNLFAVMHYQEMIRRGLLPPELDDRPKYLPEDAESAQ